MSRLYDRSFAAATLSQSGFVLANTLMAHYARWIEFLGGGVREVGWIMGAGSIVGLLLRPWMGQWINRLGARTTWVLGYAIFASSSLANLLLDGLGWPIYVLRSGLVLGAALVFTSGLTYVTQTAPIDRRTEAIGILGVGGFAGMLIGPYWGDLLLGSAARSRGDFVWLFVAAAAVLAAPAAFLSLLRAPAAPRRPGRVRLVDFIRTSRGHWPGSILLVHVIFGVCMTVPFGFLASYVDAAGLSAPGFSAIGYFFLAYAGWALTVRVGLRRLPDRMGRRKVLLAGMGFMAAGMFCYPAVSALAPWRLLLPAFLCGTGHGLIFHTMTSLALQSFPDEVRGSGSALSLMMLDLGMIGGAPVLGQIADACGYDFMFLTIGAACLLAIAFYYRASLPVWRAQRKGGRGC